MLHVDVDPGSGFCGGVIRAITRAESFLSEHPHLYSLGAIVHNEAELERLGSSGLETVEDLSGVPEGETVLIRAHGEPPQSYRAAEERGLNVIDCTCPVVLRLQQRIREAYLRLHEGGRNGTILIFGKIGHAEVLGLLGQVGGDAVVIENADMFEDACRSGRIDFSEPVEIFSQTTKSPSEYADICARLRARCEEVTVHDTICSQVAGRHSRLEEFARDHDVIVFVAGRSSSNGKVLCDLCRSVNARTWHIGSVDELQPVWFHPGDRVGVCGATSTPKWLLEQVASAIRSLPLPERKFAE